MNYALTCTTAELGLLITFAGYEEVAKSILEVSFGKRSKKEWGAMMEVTIPHLIMRGLWDKEKEDQDEIPIPDEVNQFIDSYVNSKWMIRCSDFPNQGILMIHHINEDTWLSHVVDRNIIHEFSYMKHDEIPKLIEDYYSFKKEQKHDSLQFNITDKAFDLLNKPNNMGKVFKMSNFNADEARAFEQFTQDLEHQNWQLANISFLNIPDLETSPLLENILFFLPSNGGVWMVEYTDHDKTPVHIELNSYDDWRGVLGGVAFVANQEGPIKDLKKLFND
ncbi:hypothetical protein KO561_03130 [Radiobacillus kanasensis]|uniref:hypothetical protein n=1 Tax=Radiobacillus kanasensis TaxID=2844358 RepID=UPI001E2B2FE6|nr:hypothetical protein [Radiobacillus kanasensis]UFT99970.1 hypothetical protein KO561_03130 [Radiobacillus kanasensis]